MKVLQLNAADNVVVPALLIVNAFIVFPLLVIVPVPLIVGLNEVYVPLLDNINPFKFTESDIV